MNAPPPHSTSRNRLLHSALSIAIALAAVSPAAAFTLIINGEPTLIHPEPLIEGDEVLLPGSVVGHSLGIAVLPTEPKGMWVIGAYGNRRYVRAGTTRYIGDHGEEVSPHAPRLKDNELYVPVSTLAEQFALEFTRPTEGQLEVTFPGADVLGIRHGAHEDHVRVVVDVSAPVPFQWHQDAASLSAMIPGTDEEKPTTFRAYTYPDPTVPEIIQEPLPEGGAMVAVGHRCPTHAVVFTLAEPWRIVIDFPREAPEVPQPPGPPKAPEQLAYRRVVPWQVHRLGTARGVAVAYSLLLPLSEKTYELRPALATGSVRGRATVRQIATRFGAFGALNGGYFAGNGAPLGMLMIDGEWVKEPILGRTVLGIMQDGSVQMGNVDFNGRITLPGAGEFRINSLNAGHSKTDEVILYTQRWGNETADKSKEGATRVMLTGAGQVLRVNAEGRGMVIPQGGYVLSAVGPRAAAMAKTTVGGTATLRIATSPAWPGLRHAIGGGPRLVADGRPHNTAGSEAFRSDIASGAAPRTAIGVLPNGDVLLVVADGRQQGYSAGLTLDEMAHFLVKQGVRDAMNLDGGGSSTLVVSGRLANRPSGGGERRVSNALLAFRVAPPQPGVPQ